jgi:branched-subunit amino acid aminotransferase/4-amino-4-deoxychorismate lyase
MHLSNRSAAVRATEAEGARERQRGQSLVEFTLFAPILIVLLLLSADLGRVYMGLVSANNMVRVGANYAALNAHAAFPAVPRTRVLAMVHTAVHDAIEQVVRANLEVVPASPGALYIRPVLLGVDENIGAAATPSLEAMLFVVASPVRDYFAGGQRPLPRWRSLPQSAVRSR